MIDVDRYVTAAELARIWGISRQRVDQLIRLGRIKSRKIFGRRLILKSTRRPPAIRPGRRCKQSR